MFTYKWVITNYQTYKINKNNELKMHTEKGTVLYIFYKGNLLLKISPTDILKVEENDIVLSKALYNKIKRIYKMLVEENREKFIQTITEGLNSVWNFNNIIKEISIL